MFNKMRKSADTKTKMTETFKWSQKKFNTATIKCFNKQLQIHLRQVERKRKYNTEIERHMKKLGKCGNFKTEKFNRQNKNICKCAFILNIAILKKI